MRFDKAIEFAQTHEVPWTRDPLSEPDRFGVHHEDPAPWNRLWGPVHARGGVSGVIWQNGHEIAHWGTPERADQTFSVAKTYLALLAGAAHDRGMLPDVHEPVVNRVPGIGFDDPHNAQVTWLHLLTQVSEWGGTCFGIPDTVDRYRHVSHDPKKVEGIKGSARPLQAPGTYWEYNDVRINQLSLALLHLWGRPLPEVFSELFLKPLGAGEGFRWEGYEQSWTDLPGKPGLTARRVQSVPGGTHWGGGVSISARDQARIGQMLLDGGVSKHMGASRLLSEAWVKQMQVPCPLASFYGMLTWLNPSGQTFPGASPESWFMVGAGGNYVWIEPRHQAVVVVRWLDPAHFSGFLSRVSDYLAH